MREDEKQLQRLAQGRCRFNDGVRCEDAWKPSSCSDCGWNPKVSRDRQRQRRKQEDW